MHMLFKYLAVRQLCSVTLPQAIYNTEEPA